VIFLKAMVLRSFSSNSVTISILKNHSLRDSGKLQNG
jgi:hypothetical protein